EVPRHNGIRTERYKLINFYEFGEWEFYDLKTDPDELKNLYGNPEKKELINDVRKQLLKLQKGYGDDTVLKEKPQEWKSKMRNTTSVKTKANFRPRVK
ncbi:MAG TPA: hypothetical protein DCG41_10615, partial [Verrucomicrobiales bacterium]|nr:hypothetical protein [Verrucomicrobiales bacterium]